MFNSISGLNSLDDSSTHSPQVVTDNKKLPNVPLGAKEEAYICLWIGRVESNSLSDLNSVINVTE